jgi:hypothetical protein
MPDFPLMFRLRQKFDATRLDDVPGEVRRQLTGLGLSDQVRPGASVAITAGSRGVANVRVILRAIVEHFKGLGAEPFIVPAMGSHGGGTAEGQREVVESYGITEAYLGCPIRSSMETVVVGRAAQGFDVHFDRHAHAADHVVVVNRVKPHTRFHGEIESGLMKMMLIGLGKAEGAKVYHRAIQDYDFAQIIRSVVDEVFRQCNILAGVAVIENAYDQTARIEAVRPADFESREKDLLVLAKEGMARLPFEHVDLLLIDRIGKNISGTGLDTNVVGRKFDDHKAVRGDFPKVRTIALRGLTSQTHGNAVGLGLAEFCKSSLLRETNFEITRLNALTAGHISAAMPPLDYETDRQIIELALGAVGLAEPPDSKILWIANTLELAEMECSAAYLEEARGRDDLEVLTDLRPLPLGADGNLPEMASF